MQQAGATMTTVEPVGDLDDGDAVGGGCCGCTDRVEEGVGGGSRCDGRGLRRKRIAAAVHDRQTSRGCADDLFVEQRLHLRVSLEVTEVA